MKQFLNRSILLVVISSLYLFLLFQNLGNHALIDWDEGIYAQVAKESISHPFHFTFFNQAWHEKPPIMIWLIQIGYAFFGINEFAIRFFMPTLSTATLIFTALSARTLFKNPHAEILTASAFFVSSQFMHSAFFLNPDTIAAFFASLALWSITKTLDNKRYWYVYCSAIALGIMTKSVIGLIPLGLLFLLNKNFVKDKIFFQGILLNLAIILPWHLLQTFTYKLAFWENYLGYHVLKRFTTGIENNGEPFWYYLDIFKANNLLNLLVFLTLGYFSIRSFSEKKYKVLLLNLLGVFLLLSLAGTKGYNYFLIIYPLLLLAIGVFLADTFKYIQNYVLKFSAVLTILIFFIFYGVNYNNYKLFKWSGNSAFENNKQVAKFLKTRTEPVSASSIYVSAPATWFYYGQKIPISPTNNLNLKKPIFRTPSKNVYLLNNFLYISE